MMVNFKYPFFRLTNPIPTRPQTGEGVSHPGQDGVTPLSELDGGTPRSELDGVTPLCSGLHGVPLSKLDRGTEGRAAQRVIATRRACASMPLAGKLSCSYLISQKNPHLIVKRYKVVKSFVDQIEDKSLFLSRFSILWMFLYNLHCN